MMRLHGYGLLAKKLNERAGNGGVMKDHIQELRTLLPDSIISDRLSDLAAYRDIGGKESPLWLIVRPSTYEDVSSLLAYCSEQSLPVTPWGGGTNLCQALTPDSPSIALDMKSLNKIIEVSEANYTVTVQAGATFDAIKRQLYPLGFRFCHDPWSVGSATVGGALSLDSSGNFYPIYGSIRNQVLSLKVALSDGSIIDVGSHLTKTSSMPFLPSIFIGSEGLLGVILEARFTIVQRPETDATLGYAFTSFDDMWSAICSLRDAGIEPQSYIGGTVPTKVEKMQPKSERMLVKLLGIQSALFLVYEGIPEEVDGRVKRAQDLLGQAGRKMPENYSKEWWQTRYTYFEMSPELAAEGIYVHVFDLCVPETNLLKLFAQVTSLANELGILDSLSHTIFGAPDAYTVALYVDDTAAGRELVRTCETALVPLVHDNGGSMTRTHGLGTIFSPETAEHEIGAGNLFLLKRLKRMFDPKDILNPGIMFGRE